MADLTFLVDYKTLTAANAELNKMGSTAQKSASVFQQAFRKVESSNSKALAQVKQKIAFSQKMEAQQKREYSSMRAEAQRMNAAVDAANKRSMAAKKLEAAATKAQAIETERLNSKFVQGHSAMNIYSKELNDIAIARKMDIISAEQQKQKVLELNLAMKNGTGVFGGYSGGMQGATKKTSRMGVVTQQAGYQVGDFLVQIQSGANPIMAFGQQATQLAGVMTMFGGKMLFAGAALGVLIPLATALGGVWWAARKAADEASKKTDTFAKALKDAREEVKGMSGDLALLRSGFEEAFEKTLTDAVDVATNKLNKAKKDLDEALKPTTLVKAIKPIGSEEAIKTVVDNSDLKKAVELAKVELAMATETAKQLKDRERSESIINQLYEARVILREQDKAASDETKSLQQEIAIKRLSIQFGEESLAVQRLIAQQKREQYKLEQESIGIRGQALQSLMSTYDTNVSLTGELNSSTSAAESLASAIIDAANAMASLLGMSGGLDIKIAGLESEIKAFASGADAVAAGFSGRELEKARVLRDESLATGQIPSKMVNKAYEDTVAKITKASSLTEQRNAARKASQKSSRSGGGSAKEGQDPLGDLVKRIELDTKLLGVSEARAEVMRKLGDDASKYNQDEIDAVVNRLGLYNQEKEALELVQNTQQSIADTLKSSMSEAFMSMVDGTKSFKDAMKDMAKSVIKQLFDILVVQRLVGSFDSKSGKGSGLVGAIMGALPFANGGAFSSGSQIQAYADGGVVGGPTMFPMSGGKTGLMGEAGPEAIMPLKRGKNGKLGVETSGSGSVVVNNNFNIAANGDESVKRIIQGEMPKISEATKRAVVDSKRRGGSYGRSF